jgi:hypothetical protein
MRPTSEMSRAPSIPRNSGPRAMFIKCLAGMLLSLVAGCAAGPKKPYVPPDTPASKLRTVAYMPYFGAGVDPQQQQQLSSDWDRWWNDVYPNTKWIQSQETAEILSAANLLPAWSAAEALFMKTGILPNDSMAQLCTALGTEALLQGTVYSAQAGSPDSSLMSFWRFQPGTPSSARMSFSLYSCLERKVVWRASQDLNYSSGYSYSKMIDYVHNALAGKIPEP